VCAHHDYLTYGMALRKVTLEVSARKGVDECFIFRMAKMKRLEGEELKPQL
jgi:hypothetical protein